MDAAVVRDTVEVGVAIDLVAAGVGRRITLVGLRPPEEAAARSAQLAESAGVRLVQDRRLGAPTALILELDRP